MSCSISGNLCGCWDSFQKDVRAEINKIPVTLGQIDWLIGTSLGIVSWGIYETFRPVLSAMQSAARSTVSFIENNWTQLVGYVVAWGVIITCTGLLYGFEAIALPLSIGVGCGAGFGIIMGTLTANTCDPEGDWTPWNKLNEWINGLDQNGTRQIILAVAVTVLMAASVVFPYAMGAVFGLFIGFQIAVKIATHQDLGTDAKKPELDVHAALKQSRSENEATKLRLSAVEHRLAELERRFLTTPHVPPTSTPINGNGAH